MYYSGKRNVFGISGHWHEMEGCNLDCRFTHLLPLPTQPPQYSWHYRQDGKPFLACVLLTTLKVCCKVAMSPSIDVQVRPLPVSCRSVHPILGIVRPLMQAVILLAGVSNDQRVCEHLRDRFRVLVPHGCRENVESLTHSMIVCIFCFLVLMNSHPGKRTNR